MVVQYDYLGTNTVLWLFERNPKKGGDLSQKRAIEVNLGNQMGDIEAGK